jgi:hypothetical protein
MLTTLLAERHATPQFVREVLKHDNLVLLLGGLRSGFGDQHSDAVAVGGEVPRGAAECGDPRTGFFGDEGVALHRIADGHQLVAGMVYQLGSGAGPVRIEAAVI